MAMNITTVMGDSAVYSLGDTVGLAVDLGGVSATITYEPYIVDWCVIKGNTEASAETNGYYYHITSRLNTSPSPAKIVAESAIRSWASIQTDGATNVGSWSSQPTTT